jgi:hypothetical protein
VTPELAAAHTAEIEDMTGAVILDGQQQSMALFNEHFPFNSDGSGPSLDMEHASEVTRGRQQP